MDKNRLCTALYALPGDIVVKHRKPLVRAAADGGGGRRVARTERFFGGCGTQQPQVGDRAGRRYAAGDRRSLGAGASERVAGNALPPAVAVVHAFRGALFRPLASGRSDRAGSPTAIWRGLLRMPRQSIPAVAVMVCRTRDNALAACQAFEYAELEYKPLCEMKVMDKA